MTAEVWSTFILALFFGCLILASCISEEIRLRRDLNKHYKKVREDQEKKRQEHNEQAFVKRLEERGF